MQVIKKFQKVGTVFFLLVVGSLIGFYFATSPHANVLSNSICISDYADGPCQPQSTVTSPTTQEQVPTLTPSVNLPGTYISNSADGLPQPGSTSCTSSGCVIFDQNSQPHPVSSPTPSLQPATQGVQTTGADAKEPCN